MWLPRTKVSSALKPGLRPISSAALLTLGCSLGSYDYLSAEFGAQAQAGAGSGGASGAAGNATIGGSAGDGAKAGAAPDVEPCEGKDDGTPCDDDDVCTTTSLCVSGICQGSGDHPCVVADSIAEFSTTQGVQGFWYGAWAQGGDADGTYQPESDFAELTACPPDAWKPACVDVTDPSFRWTLLTAQLAHAATIPKVEVAVRRWVSDVSGRATASLDHHHADPGDGDGTRAQLLLDGALIWENEISASDAVGKQAEIPLTLSLGTRVELLLYPRANQARDMSHLSIVLRGRN
jgi:hypothetical protein